jgi:hypothetical protein
MTEDTTPPTATEATTETTTSQPTSEPSNNCTAATALAGFFGGLSGLLLLFCVIVLVLYIDTCSASSQGTDVPQGTGAPTTNHTEANELAIMSLNSGV